MASLGHDLIGSINSFGTGQYAYGNVEDMVMVGAEHCVVFTSQYCIAIDISDHTNPFVTSYCISPDPDRDIAPYNILDDSGDFIWCFTRGTNGYSWTSGHLFKLDITDWDNISTYGHITVSRLGNNGCFKRGNYLFMSSPYSTRSFSYYGAYYHCAYASTGAMISSNLHGGNGVGDWCVHSSGNYILHNGWFGCSGSCGCSVIDITSPTTQHTEFNNGVGQFGLPDGHIGMDSEELNTFEEYIFYVGDSAAAIIHVDIDDHILETVSGSGVSGGLIGVSTGGLSKYSDYVVGVDRGDGTARLWRINASVPSITLLDSHDYTPNFSGICRIDSGYLYVAGISTDDFHIYSIDIPILDPRARVTGIIHRLNPGEYSTEINMGALVAGLGVPDIIRTGGDIEIQLQEKTAKLLVGMADNPEAYAQWIELGMPPLEDLYG